MSKKVLFSKKDDGSELLFNSSGKILYFNNIENILVNYIQERDGSELPSLIIVNSKIVLNNKKDVGIYVCSKKIYPRNLFLKKIWKFFGFYLSINIINGIPVDRIYISECKIIGKNN